MILKMIESGKTNLLWIAFYFNYSLRCYCITFFSYWS